ncbi:thermopsin family protease [Stygiolobus caldivivus]|uniref:Thermopsin n=1 Tax=Stygiolobus caldivivus TaxID=2824673 RepID=A0A8D5U6Q5_9CREN|nr:thermopsin family protease [Stygiolobus caldivivus]BCU69998.1 hypothetical protein KN1_12950 [Stygiolobus caldivivus]
MNRLIIAFIVMTTSLLFLISALHSSASAIGINDIGLTSQGQNYVYNTTSVKGYFIFYGGSFYSGKPVNYNVASVQLNTVLTNGIYCYFVQNVLVVIANGNGTYTISFVDNLWNLTPPYTVIPSAVEGNGEVCKAPNTSDTYFYFYAFPQNITLRPPFNVTLISNVSVVSGYIELRFIAILTNSDFSQEFVYDDVRVLNPSSQAYFIVGRNIDYPTRADVELVIGGGGSASTLYVYNWSSKMMLLYLYDGRYYEVPSAISYSYITAESAQGIYEYYDNGYVVQTAGNNYYGELWDISANITVVNYSKVEFNLVPAYGEWSYEINGKVFPVNSSEIGLPYGEYNITVFLSVGQTLLYEKTFKNIVVKPYVVVKSEVPSLYVNGEKFTNYTKEGGYYVFYIPFKGPLKIEFPQCYYLNDSRLKLVGVLLDNGSVAQSDVVCAESPGVYTATYQLQYLIRFPYNITVEYDGSVYHVSSMYFTVGSSVYVPEQNITFPNGTLVEVLNQTVKVREGGEGGEINLLTKVFYYVKFLYNGVYVNQLPRPGFYPKGYCISLPKELRNSTTIVIINSSYYKVKVLSPLSLRVNVTVYYRVTFVLGNYSVHVFYERGSTVDLTSNITVNDYVVFVVEKPLTLTVNSPQTVSLEGHFMVYYLVEVHYLNRTISALLPEGGLFTPGNVSIGNYTYVFSPVDITHPGAYFLNYTVYDKVIDELPTGETIVLYVKNGTYASVPVYYDGKVVNETVLVTSSPLVVSLPQSFALGPGNYVNTTSSSDSQMLKIVVLVSLVAGLLVTVALMRKSR